MSQQASGLRRLQQQPSAATAGGCKGSGGREDRVKTLKVFWTLPAPSVSSVAPLVRCPVLRCSAPTLALPAPSASCCSAPCVGLPSFRWCSSCSAARPGVRHPLGSLTVNSLRFHCIVCRRRRYPCTGRRRCRHTSVLGHHFGLGIQSALRLLLLFPFPASILDPHRSGFSYFILIHPLLALHRTTEQRNKQ